MLPQLFNNKNKARSYSLSVEKYKKYKSRRNTSYYASVIIDKLQCQSDVLQSQQEQEQKPSKGSLIILVNDSDQFLQGLLQDRKYVQFLKQKDYMSNQQLEEIQKMMNTLIVSQINNSYTYHYCAFTQNGAQIDLEYIESKQIYEIIFEFTERQTTQKFNFIFGIDLILLHKTKFRQIFLVSENRLDYIQLQYNNPKKYIRFHTHTHSVNENNLDTYNENLISDNPMDTKMQQVGTQKKNKEIRQFLIDQNKKKHLISQQKELIIQKVTQKQCISQPVPIELPQICDQVYSKFLKLFKIQQLQLDQIIFSQFLLLCELSIFYSKNTQLQVSIQKLENDQAKVTTLLQSILYFDYKILRAMNNRLQLMNATVTKCFLRFLKQGQEYDRQNRLYWHDFSRFKQYYIDQNWEINDLRLFMLLMNDESPLTVQHLMNQPNKECQKKILQMKGDDLKQLVFSQIKL